MIRKNFISIFILILLVNIVSVQAEDLIIKTYELDNTLHIISINVITNNPYYFRHYYKNAVQEGIDYKLNFKDEKDQTIFETSVQNLAKTLIDFDNKISQTKKILVLKNSSMLYEKEINFCNYNNICEPCLNADCTNYENEISCNDCATNSKDNYCNVLDDNICDPDCVPIYQYDVPNVYEGCYEEEFFIKKCEEYGYKTCKNNQECTGVFNYILSFDNKCCVQGECVDELPKEEVPPEKPPVVIPRQPEEDNTEFIMQLFVTLALVLLIIFLVYYISKNEGKHAKK